MKHLKQNLLLITILIVVFSSCKKETGITGIVKDNANTLVEGVEISVDGTVLATTDEYGSYEILDLIEGKYTLTTNKTGYLTFSQEINIEKKSIAELNLTIEKIAFTIIAPHSTSVWEIETQNRISWTNNYPGNVKIELYEGNNLNQVIETTTENDGAYDWTIPSDLAAGTDYKIKITSVDNSEIVSQSSSFEITRPLPPTATTQTASGILSTSVNLNAYVNANDLETTVSFEYGTTTSYGNTISPTTSLITGNNDEYITSHLTGLTESTLYHFRIKAESSAGITYGNDLTFTTLSSTGAYLAEFTGKTLDYNNGSSSWNYCTAFFGINSDEVTSLSPTATASSLDIGLAAQNTYGNVLASPDVVV